MAKKNVFSGSGKTASRIKKKQGNKEKPQSQPMIRAMVWYKEEHYQKLLSIFDDAELLPVSFQDWLNRAEEKKSEVEADGDQVIKVFIDPETFPEWCKQKKLAKDANSRSQLAIEVAQAQSFTV